MYLIVNDTELNVNNAYAERDINTNVLTAVIEVPYYVMDFVALKTLFMENTGIITKVNDDGFTESWDGFVYDKPPVDDGTQYRIVLVGNENTYQIERLRHLEQVLVEKESKIAEQEEMIVAKDVLISEQSARISEKDTTIYEQSTLIEEQKTDIANKEMVLSENEAALATQEEEITQLRQALETKTAELVSKEEEVLTLAEQCADLIYNAALAEIATLENEVVTE